MARESGEQQEFQNIRWQDFDGLTAGKLSARKPCRKMLQTAQRLARFGMGEKPTARGKQPPNRREDRFQPNLARCHSHPLSRFASQEVAMQKKALRHFSKQPRYCADVLIGPRL